MDYLTLLFPPRHFREKIVGNPGKGSAWIYMGGTGRGIEEESQRSGGDPEALTLL